MEGCLSSNTICWFTRGSAGQRATGRSPLSFPGGDAVHGTRGPRPAQSANGYSGLELGGLPGQFVRGLPPSLVGRPQGTPTAQHPRGITQESQIPKPREEPRKSSPGGRPGGKGDPGFGPRKWSGRRGRAREHPWGREGERAPPKDPRKERPCGERQEALRNGPAGKLGAPGEGGRQREEAPEGKLRRGKGGVPRGRERGQARKPPHQADRTPHSEGPGTNRPGFVHRKNSFPHWTRGGIARG